MKKTRMAYNKLGIDRTSTPKLRDNLKSLKSGLKVLAGLELFYVAIVIYFVVMQGQTFNPLYIAGFVVLAGSVGFVAYQISVVQKELDKRESQSK
jgi:hypothetical protein